MKLFGEQKKDDLGYGCYHTAESNCTPFIFREEKSRRRNKWQMKREREICLITRLGLNYDSITLIEAERMKIEVLMLFEKLRRLEGYEPPSGQKITKRNALKSNSYCEGKY